MEQWVVLLIAFGGGIVGIRKRNAPRSGLAASLGERQLKPIHTVTGACQTETHGLRSDEHAQDVHLHTISHIRCSCHGSMSVVASAKHVEGMAAFLNERARAKI